MADRFDWLLHENLLPKCSCSKCDSMTCFAQRYKCLKEKCTCINCKESKTCLFYPNKKLSHCHSNDSNGNQCKCRIIQNSSPNMRTIPAPVNNIIYGPSKYKRFGVNKDYYNIYVNEKQLGKSYQSNPPTDKLNISCQNEYKMRKNVNDYYDIYVNKKPSSKQTDTTTLKQIKCNRSSPTVDKFTVYCIDEYKMRKNIKNYYDIYVNQKPSSKKTDTSTMKKIKCNTCKPATDKFTLNYEDEHNKRQHFNKCYDIYVNQKPTSKQTDTTTLKQAKCNSCNPTTDTFKLYCGEDYNSRKNINNFYDVYVNKKPISKETDTTTLKQVKCNSCNPTTDTLTLYCGDDYNSRKNINDFYDIYVNKKKSSVQTDPVTTKCKEANPATNDPPCCCGSDSKMHEQFYDDISLNGKQSSKHITETPKPSIKSKETNPTSDKFAVSCENEYNTRKTINNCNDICANKNQSSVQTDPCTTKCKQANPAPNNLTCRSDWKTHNILKYYEDIYLREKLSSKHTDTVTLKPTCCASIKSEQSNPTTDQCKVCGANKNKARENKCDIKVHKKQPSTHPDNFTKYMDCCTTTKRTDPRPYKVKEYETSEYTYDYGKNTTTVTKKQSSYLHKTAVPRYNACAKELDRKNKKNITQIHNVSISNDYPCKHVDPSSEKTSAQIMDVLYNDIKESVGSSTCKNTPSKTTKLTEYDIIKRIKEAYKACSCKVCECVVALTVSNAKDQCNCKPCECIDCRKYRNGIQLMSNRKQVPGSNCPCIRCTNSQCKGISNPKKEQCACPEYSKDLSKSCFCKPCQCIECKSMYKGHNRAWVVAPVEQTTTRNLCDCSPCACLQCTQANGTSSNRTHEVSTGINRHPNCHCEACPNDACTPDGNATCKCGNFQGVTRKPISKDSHDYDVRRTSVNKHDKCCKNHDTITMYASVSNTYPRFRKSHKFDSTPNMPPFIQNKCGCNACECLVCLNEDIINNIKYPQMNSSEEMPIPLKKNIDMLSCNRAPCGCEIQSNQNNVIENGTQEIRNNKYKCNVWDIIRSSCIPTKYTKDVRFSTKYSSEKCTGKDITISNESLVPYKTRELLIPCVCRFKNLGVNHMKTNCTTKKSQTTIQQECSSNCTFSERHGFKQEQQNQQTKRLTRKRRNSCHQAVKSLERLINYEYNDSYTQCDAYKKPIFSGYNKDVELSTNYVSGYSSVANTSKISDLNENDSIRPISHRKHSWESSCNSSGHDCQDYLVTFPKAAVVDYIKDVMKLDMDKDPKLDQLSKILSKINTENGKYMKRCNKYQNSKISQVDSIDNKKLNSCDQNVSNNEINPHKSYSGSYNSNTLINKIKSQDFDKCCCVHEIGLQSEKNNSSDSSLPFQRCFKNYFAKEIILPLPDHINQMKLPKNVENNRLIFFDDAFISEKQFDKSSLNQHNSTWNNGKLSLYSHNNKSMNLFQTDEDFKRVLNTLQEAKKFSSHLMQILERYDKANREFESMSEKLKLAHEPTFNGKMKNMCIKNSEIPIMNKGDGQNESLNEIDCKTNEINMNPIENLPKISDLNEDQSCSLNGIDLTKVNEVKDGHSLANKIESSHTISKEDINTDTLSLNKPVINNISSKSEYNHLNDSLQNALRRQTKEIEKNTKLMQENSKNFETSFNEILNLPPTIPKRFSFINVDAQKIKPMIETKMPTNTSDINLSLTISEDKKVNSLPIKFIHTREEYNDHGKINMPQVIRRFGVRFGSTEEIIGSPTTIIDNVESTIELEQPIEVLVINQREIADPTLNKNFCLHYNGGYNSSLLDDKIHMTVDSISMQKSTSFSINYELDNSHHSLVDLQVQVSDLLNLPLLQTLDPIIETEGLSISYNQPLKNNSDLQIVNDKFSHDESMTMSSRSSSDSFKVCFRKLRRVSDHTVLVKWKLPQAIDDVQGYELLVDGVPVEKFSPSRCMAVVTCLPHSDRVLLTIRTLISKTSEAGHCPLANIVYFPRNK